MCLSRWCIGGVSVSYVLIFMSATSENNKRIAKNTLFLYMRMLLIMGVTLYTSRIVLQVLGVEDFGIYNVVGESWLCWDLSVLPCLFPYKDSFPMRWAEKTMRKCHGPLAWPCKSTG